MRKTVLIVLALVFASGCGSSNNDTDTVLPTRFVPPTPEVTEALEITPEVTLEITPEVTPIVHSEITPEVTLEVSSEVTPEVVGIQLEVTLEVTPEVQPESTPEPQPVESVYDLQAGELVTIEGRLTGYFGDDIDVQMVLVDLIGNEINILSSGTFIPPTYFESTVSLEAVVVESQVGELSLYPVDLPDVISAADDESLLTPQSEPTGLFQLNRLLHHPELEGYILTHFQGNPIIGWEAQLLNPETNEFVAYSIGITGGDWSMTPWVLYEIIPEEATPINFELITVDTDQLLQAYEDDFIQMREITVQLQMTDDGLVWVINLSGEDVDSVNAQ